jgi:predicted MPP superfamily phosphohydrolase
MSGKTVTWLHLSDLHTCAPKTGWDSYRVLETLEDDLKYMENHYDLHPDFIVFTGDAVFGHLPTQGFNIAEQFKDAERFFSRVRESFISPVPKNRFFIVPGNHDIDRNMVTDDQIQWLLTQGNQDAITAMIHSGNRQWQRAMERLNSYKDFLENEEYFHLLPDPKRLIFTNCPMSGHR